MAPSILDKVNCFVFIKNPATRKFLVGYSRLTRVVPRIFFKMRSLIFIKNYNRRIRIAVVTL